MSRSGSWTSRARWMLSLRRGRVTAVVERHEGFARIEVDGDPCVAYPRLTGPVAVGDDVLVNVQARVLELGSGGFDVLYANLTRGLGLPVEEGAHVMKLPYLPGQLAVRYAEEDAALDARLEGMPVVCCSVHSQVVPVCAALEGHPLTPQAIALAADLAVDAARPISDQRGSAEFRRHLVRVLTRRTLTLALERATA